MVISRRWRGRAAHTRTAAWASAVLVAISAAASPAAGAVDPENASVAELQAKLSTGEVTSEQLTRTYINRIAALNGRGPGLNAVRALNPNAIAEARQRDVERAQGKIGPLQGIPVLVKDNHDVKGIATTAGSLALESSIPDRDSFVVARLRAAGAVVLGKTNLTEFAGFLSDSTPNGYSGLGGQVLNPYDPDFSPGGSSSGSAAAAVAGLAVVALGSETASSIIAPAAEQGAVGLRPTHGLVSRTGLLPVAGSQDVSGPLTRTVADAAAALEAIAGRDPADAATSGAPEPVPDYTGALRTDALRGARIGVVANSDPRYQAAVTKIQELGATTVSVGEPAEASAPPAIQCAFRRDLNAYLGRLPSSAPMDSLADVIAFNDAHDGEALKFGQTRLVRAQSDGSSDSECAANAASGRTQSRESIDAALTRGTADKSDDLDALMTFGSGASAVGARAGYPQITVPAGYDGSTPRPRNVSFLGRGYSEERLLSLAYSYEQGSKLRRAPSAVNPALYRCAPTKEQGSWPRRSCAPGAELLNTIGSVPALGFSLETATIQDLQSRQSAGSLSAENLTKAYLARIARTNAEGPSLNAVRSVDPDALADARARDAERAQGNTRGPLHGIPLLVSDSFDVEGLPTTAGSLALEGNVAARDSRVVARLRQAGAVILGKTNTGELGGFMSYDIPPGYSALGGQPLNPYDADLTPGGYQDVDHPKAPDLPGASAGAAPAAAAGLAAAVITKDTSGGVVNPAVANGVVGLRPTFGAVSRTGTLPTARSQDTPAPLAKTVRDATTLLDAIAGPDPQDPDTSEAPQAPNYTAALSTSAPSGKRLGVVESPDPAYNAAVNRLRALGATTVAVDPPSPSSLDHVLDYELKRDLNAYLAAAGGATTSLADIIAYNRAHADEALKYGQSRLEISQGHDLSAGASAYASRRDAGRAESRQRIDAILTRGTSITGDDLDAIVEPGVAGGVTTWSLTGLFPATRVRSAPVAARAGYPQLTVPAGYSEGSGYDSKTRNPVEISLLGPEDGDAVLLAMGHAYERATQLRQAPSATNPSLWRCVPGGAVDAHACAPGDFVSESAPNRVTPDFNGDGHSDAAIGAPDEADGTLAGAGFVNVMYGGAGGLARAGAQQFSQSLAGGLTETGDRFGAATSAADFNGDGFTDLAVGAPDEADVDVPKAGFVNVVYGSSTGLRQSGAQQFSQSQAGGMREAGDRFGAALAAGDVNGDGYADLAVGAPDEADFDIAAAGFVSILYGSPTGLRQSGAQQFSQSQAGGVREEGDRFGAALAVGNFDGDQYADLAVGAPDENDFDVVDAGFVNVLYGGAGGVASSRSAQFSQSQAGGVREAGDRFGSALAVGNFDADEFTDLAVGAPDEDDQTIDAAGFVNVVYGTSGGLGRGRTQQFNQSFAGGLTEAGDRFGSALAAGRFDSDLKSDLAVGAPDEDDGSLKDAGFVNVVYGTGSGLGGSLRRQFNQSQAAGLTEPGDRFGAALTAANYDGDGDWDLLVGAPDENAGVLVRGGLVNMLLGAGDAGLGSSGARQFDQGWGGGNPEAGDRFGAALR